MERRGPAIEPREIKHEDDFTVSIVWGDDRRCRYEQPISGAPVLVRSVLTNGRESVC